MLTLFFGVTSVFVTIYMTCFTSFPSSFAIVTGYIGEIFIFPETEDFELPVSIFINALTMKNKVKRDLNWAKTLLIKQSLENNHLN